MHGERKLEDIAEQMKTDQEKGMKPSKIQVSVREFMRWFGYERRGKYIVSRIRNKMDDLEIRTVPDFEFVYIDTRIRFELLPQRVGSSKVLEGPDDPTVRIGALAAANKMPSSVKPDEALEVATTLMQIKDYSQLPVMVNRRGVKGIITWRSIGNRLALGHECSLVRECMDPAQDISIAAPLFNAIEDISEHGYVLVRGKDLKITGIVTASDVVNQFRQLAGPFLAIGEIEGHLRRLIHRRFTVDELKKASLDEGEESRIGGLADLTFGDYVRLLEKKQNWRRLDLYIDRVGFIKALEEIRKIRNDVLHFDPEGLDPDYESSIEDFVKFFRDLVRMKTI